MGKKHNRLQGVRLVLFEVHWPGAVDSLQKKMFEKNKYVQQQRSLPGGVCVCVCVCVRVWFHLTFLQKKHVVFHHSTTWNHEDDFLFTKTTDIRHWHVFSLGVLSFIFDFNISKFQATNKSSCNWEATCEALTWNPGDIMEKSNKWELFVQICHIQKPKNVVLLFTNWLLDTKICGIQ